MTRTAEARRTHRELRQAGWDVKKGRGGHVKATSPEGELIVLSSSPSDHRTQANDRARLRRAGFDPASADPFKLERKAANQTERDAWQRHLQVLDLLMEADKPMTARGIADKLGETQPKVLASLQFLIDKKVGVRKLPPITGKPGKGPGVPPALFCYRELSEVPEGPPVESQTEESQTEAPAGTAVVAPEVVLTPGEDRRPIICRPGSKPEDAPSLLEFVAVQRGNLIGQDENGELWLCVPMKAVLPGSP